MYVIADIEWVTTRGGIISPVQLAAVRVDENWNEINSYYTFIKPLDRSFDDWKQIACNGGNKFDFLTARNAADVISDFLRWLNRDILLWWLDQSNELFSRLVVDLLKNTEPPEAMSISKYVQAFLVGQPHSRSNVYTLAASRGVATKNRLKHCSDDDVWVIRQLMQTIEYPQSKLLEPVVFPETQNEIPEFKYIYDKSTNTIHVNSCENIPDGEHIGYPNFTTALKKDYKPCKCCKSEYLAALKERNRDIISRVRYNYLYSVNSNVFHKPTCKTILAAKDIKGSELYETAVNTGRTPCRLCNPVPIEKPLWAVSTTKKAKPASTQGGRLRSGFLLQRLRRFNPRPHAGGRPYPPRRGLCFICFNPRPHAGGDFSLIFASETAFRFNPRPHAGATAAKRLKRQINPTAFSAFRLKISIAAYCCRKIFQKIFLKFGAN